MNQNQSIIDGIVGLVNERRLFDRMPTNEQCRDCIKVASQRVLQSGGAIQHCDFHGPHIGSRYGELRPRLVLVGLENPEESDNCNELEVSNFTDLGLEKTKAHFKGSVHREGEFAFIQRVFPSAEVPFAHVATLNRRLHGLKRGRNSESKKLPVCPHVAEILRLLRPEVIVMEERDGLRPAGNGWGTWIPNKVFREKVGNKQLSAAVMTTELDEARVALVLANHPSRPYAWRNLRKKDNYTDNVLVPAVLLAMQLAVG